jgi:prevent-host-death family protein
MTTVNMLEAKTNLSRLVEAVETGREPEIVIARNGRPVARLVPVGTVSVGHRIGVAKGKFKAPDPDPALDAAIAKRFTGR